MSQTRFDIDGREYEWAGGFGAMIISHERGVGIGDVRWIKNRLFRVYNIERKRFRKSRVWWILAQEHTSAEELRTLKADMLGVDRSSPLDRPTGPNRAEKT